MLYSPLATVSLQRLVTSSLLTLSNPDEMLTFSERSELGDFPLVRAINDFTVHCFYRLFSLSADRNISIVCFGVVDLHIRSVAFTFRGLLFHHLFCLTVCSPTVLTVVFLPIYSVSIQFISSTHQHFIQ